MLALSVNAAEINSKFNYEAKSSSPLIQIQKSFFFCLTFVYVGIVILCRSIIDLQFCIATARELQRQ